MNMDQAQAEQREEPSLVHLSLDSSNCSICDQILKCFTLPKLDQCMEILGTVSEVVSPKSTCPNHVPIIEKTIAEYNQTLLSNGQEPAFKNNSEDTREIEVVKFKARTYIDLFLWDGINEIPMPWTKNLVYDKNRPNHPGNSLILDEKFMDVKMVQRWKGECEKNHEKCRFRRSIQMDKQVRPLLLIDTHDRCIVSSQNIEDDFVALSYCWGRPDPGQPEWFRNEKSIKDALAMPKALAPGSEFGERLPKTIKDTIELVQQVGERYLWIDSLCIVQDDYEMKNIELPKMSEIYASACLTIIAAEGSHADFGLPGFEFTRPRILHQNVVDIGSEKLVTPITYSGGSSYGTVAYYSRGWTFQEYQFGRRRLVLENQSVRWECSEAAWYEDLKDIQGLEFRGKQYNAAEMPDPGIEDFNEIVNQYNTRQLGRKEDAFPAFCGYQRVLSRTYKHGFINGMPIAFFDIAMSWIPQSTNLEKRKAENSQLDPPSWSWIGWTGMIDMMFSDDQHLINDIDMYSLHVNKLTDWYTMLSLDAPKVPILESSQPPTDDFALAKEPSLLFCKTQSATFQVGKCLYDSTRDVLLMGPWYHIRDSTGKWAGVLRFHNEDDAANLSDTSIELVAISKGHTLEKEQGHELFGFMELNVEERPKTGSEYHYYNVLWIQRDGNIAYRKAGGRIEKTLWEASNPKPIELVLR